MLAFQIGVGIIGFKQDSRWRFPLFRIFCRFGFRNWIHIRFLGWSGFGSVGRVELEIWWYDILGVRKNSGRRNNNILNGWYSGPIVFRLLEIWVFFGGMILYKVFFRDVINLKPPGGGRKLRRGNTGHPTCIYVSVARFDGVIPLPLHCADFFL